MKKDPSINLLQAIIWREDNDYVAQCLNVDVSSYGSTRQEALQSLREALSLYFQDEPTQTIDHVDGPEVVSLTLSDA